MIGISKKFYLFTFCLLLIFALTIAIFNLIYSENDVQNLISSSSLTNEKLNSLEPNAYNYSEMTSITEQNGLGLGINVVTASSIRDFKTSYSILDYEALQMLPTSRISLNSSISSFYSATSEETLINQYEESFSMGIEQDIFLISLKDNLQTGSSFDFTNYMYKYYYVLNHEIEKYNLYINNYGSANTYQNAYSDLFLADLANLSNGSLNYVQFFDKYGTHLVGSAIYGGELNMNFSVVSNSVRINSNYTNIIDSKVTFPNISSSINIDITNAINTTFSTNYESDNIQSCFNVIALGGSTFGSTLVGDFSSQYTNWINSFDSADINSIIVDYTSQGLVPLWSILPAQYSSLATSMENAYIQLCSNYKNEFIDVFKTGNYIDFDGGIGDVSNPYKISTAEQLAKIGNFDMDACYELTNNINLSGYYNWNAIGGHYKENFFDGLLNGNNYTISNLTRTSDITEVNSRIYFGLFGAIGPDGIVKNLKFSNIYINMLGPAVNNANTRVFVGAVAGYNSGNINHVEVISGSITYDCCTNGTSHVGGISGIVHNGAIDSCINRASIKSGRYSATAGGMAGYLNWGTIGNCTNYGSVTTYCTKWWGNSISGGIVGEANLNAYLSVFNYNNYGALNTYDYGTGPCAYYYKGDDIGKKTSLDVS